MNSIQNILDEVFGGAIRTAFPDVVDPPIVISLSTRGQVDYQCNSAMQLVNTLKQLGMLVFV